MFVFSDSAAFDKVSTAIRVKVAMLNGHYLTIGSIFQILLSIAAADSGSMGQKMSLISSQSVTAWSNYVLVFLTVI